MRALLIALALLVVVACESTTEVRYVSCKKMEIFPNDTTATVADSVRFSDCNEESWEGTTIRRKP